MPLRCVFRLALHEHLAAGSDKGSALRQANLDLLQQFGDQTLRIYWAGFTLVGEGSIGVVKPMTEDAERDE